MKTKLYKPLSLMVLSIVIFLAGCSSGNNNGAGNAPEAGQNTPSPANSNSGKPNTTPEADNTDNKSFSGTVKVLREWGDAQPNKAMFDALGIAFMEQYPNVKLEYVTAGGTAALQSMVAASDSPDVVMTYSPQPNFMKDNLLEDLTPYLEQYPEVNVDQFYAPSFNKYYVGDKLYGLPWNIDPNFGLHSNRKILDQYGVTDVPELNSLEDLGNYLKQFWVVKDGKQEMTTFDPSSLWGGGTAMLTWSLINGATAEDIYDPKTRKVGYNNPKIVEAVEWLADFYQENINPERINELKGTLPENTDLFDANKMAVSFYSTKKMREEMDVILTPMPEEGLWVGGYGFSLVSTSKNKDAAFQFIKWLTTTENAAKISNDILGVMPAKKDLPFLQEKAQSDPYLALALDILSKVKKYPPQTPVDLPETFEADFVAVLNGTSSEDPQTFLDNLTKIMQQKVDEYYK
ncbi:extracellular solute-binding protein [Paenibacillus nasutitermitis]|uniref:ABC transporter substrate-binding protein n=1 Tax=Paenibacillus nasutitermitis TaxID=1652958 RepID=A0A916ZEU2_9BACL|nr:extracellular solute-binding protein [Paenibacillus nasutitermitis]GGD93473.1 hypothetical protein GCM10010911_60130 [Paenibacillus nasutitermitis]